jgi:hypothetical protein
MICPAQQQQQQQQERREWGGGAGGIANELPECRGGYRERRGPPTGTNEMIWVREPVRYIHTHTSPPPLLHLLDDCYVNKRVVHKRLEMIKRNRKVERRRWRYLLLDLCASSYYLFLFFKNLFRLFSVVSSSRHNLNESAITLLLLLLFSLLFSHRLLIFNLFWFHRFCPSFFSFLLQASASFIFPLDRNGRLQIQETSLNGRGSCENPTAPNSSRYWSISTVWEID